ncbi:two-component system response regulator RgbR [Gottschalkiaceae bacterium SANA]|nr:two-component system response regulator RgbR [Gottschalkiaceae bacterium SANA]
MIELAICDDEVKEIEHTQAMIMQYINKHPQYDIKIHSFSAPLELLSFVEENGGFDVLLLDIYMAGIKGIDLARELRTLGDEGEIIFLTTSRNHSLEAFEVNAAQYLVKPYGKESFFSALDQVMRRIEVDRRAVIVLKTSEGISRIAPRDVVYTETSRNNYQLIHAIQGQKMEVRMTSAELFALLSVNKFFIRCGASLNLNLKYIRQISKKLIFFDTGDQIAYPYRSYKKLKEEFLHFQM